MAGSKITSVDGLLARTNEQYLYWTLSATMYLSRSVRSFNQAIDYNVFSLITLIITRPHDARTHTRIADDQL